MLCPNKIDDCGFGSCLVASFWALVPLRLLPVRLVRCLGHTKDRVGQRMGGFGWRRGSVDWVNWVGCVSGNVRGWRSLVAADTATFAICRATDAGLQWRKDRDQPVAGGASSMCSARCGHVSSSCGVCKGNARFGEGEFTSAGREEEVGDDISNADQGNQVADRNDRAEYRNGDAVAEKRKSGRCRCRLKCPTNFWVAELVDAAR